MFFFPQNGKKGRKEDGFCFPLMHRDRTDKKKIADLKNVCQCVWQMLIAIYSHSNENECRVSTQASRNLPV